MRMLKLLNSVVTTLTAFMLAFMTIMVLLQVFFRYILEMPFPQSQELAVYAMVYIVTFGSSIAVYNGTHVAVTFLVEKCPRTLKYLLRVAVCILMVIFFALLVKYGYDLSMRSMMQRGTATGIQVGYVVASIPISAGISLLYVLGQLWQAVQSYLHGDDLPSTTDKQEN